MRILILDDDDMRHNYFRRELANHEVVHAHTYDEACDALSSQDRFDTVFLDHDLNFEQYRSVQKCDDGYEVELDGKDAAHYLVGRVPQEKRPGQIVVHSWNETGAREMVAILKDGGFTNVVRWVFNPKQPLRARG